MHLALGADVLVHESTYGKGDDDAVGGGECQKVLLEGTTYRVGVGCIGTVDAVVEKLTCHATEQRVASGRIGAYLAQQVVEWRVAIMLEAAA